MAPSSLKKLGVAFAFASAGRVAAHSSPDLLGNVVDAIFGEAPTSTHSHTTSYVTGAKTTVNDVGETTVVVVVDTTICPVTAAEATESSVLATATSPVPVLTTATSETAAVATSLVASGSGVGSTSVLQSAANSTSIAMTTSTIFATHSSTITACPTAASASNCNVGDVTTVVVALSTTVCPVTATEGATNSTVRPTASGNVPGFGTSRTGTLGATTKTGSPPLPTSAGSSVSVSSFRTASSSVRPQSTITSPSVILTTVSATTKTSESESSGTVLEMATGSPSDYSAQYTDATETVAVPSATPDAPTTTDYNSALMSLASSVQASSAEQTGTGCTGMDCIVVSNSGVKSKMNASGFALAALAGAAFLL
ncbi:hypothetical protein diail_2182 [Diaporthe ilicicola]|nr:hypothetical protein diail_2182 [Diaporthe ilicicola]